MQCVANDDAATSSDQESFSLLVREQRPMLVGLARRILVRPEEAEDVVQEVLLRVWRRWAKRAPDTPAAYLVRAVTLTAVKRRLRSRRHVPLDRIDPASLPPSIPAIDPYELERVISRLPVSQQAVLRMRFYVGLSMAQISRDLRISYNTVASRCRYALAALRLALNVPARQTQKHKEFRHD